MTQPVSETAEVALAKILHEAIVKSKERPKDVFLILYSITNSRFELLSNEIGAELPPLKEGIIYLCTVTDGDVKKLGSAIVVSGNEAYVKAVVEFLKDLEFNLGSLILQIKESSSP